MGVNLVDLLPAQVFVSIGRGSVEVFGVTLTQVSVLLSEYEDVLKANFSAVDGVAIQPDFSKLLSELPGLMEELVAMGIHAEDQPELVARIPVSSKVEILSAMWSLSVIDPKKLVEVLKETLQGIQHLVKKTPA